MGTKDTFRTLPIDLSRLADAGRAALSASLDVAAREGVAEFSALAPRMTTTHPPMRSRVRVDGRGGVIELYVATKRPLLEYVEVSPGLSTDTTGRNRRLVTVTGWRGRSVKVEKGFVWNGKVWRRSGRTFVSARRYLAAEGALPSPAEILADAAEKVANAVTGAIRVD